MAAVHIADADFEKEVLQSPIPVFVDFYAEWCGPCKMASPIIDSLADEFDGKVKIVKVDVDQNQVAGNYGVMSIPTVVAFANGKEVAELRQIGFPGEAKYREILGKLIAA